MPKCNDSENFKETRKRGKKMTPERTRLLRVLIDAEYFDKKITVRCKAAKCSRSVYYTAMEDPDFREAIKEHSMDMMVQDLPAVFSAALETAKKGTHQGHADRKLVMNMLGLNVEADNAMSEFSIGALLKEIAGHTASIPNKDTTDATPSIEKEPELIENAGLDIPEVAKEGESVGFKH